MNELQSQSRSNVVYNKPRRRRSKWKRRLRAMSEYSAGIAALAAGILLIWLLLVFLAG